MHMVCAWSVAAGAVVGGEGRHPAATGRHPTATCGNYRPTGDIGGAAEAGFWLCFEGGLLNMCLFLVLTIIFAVIC